MIDSDGVSLLGIRVLWTISSVYTRSCQYQPIRLELHGNHAREVTVSDTSTEFFNPTNCIHVLPECSRPKFDAPEIDSWDIGIPLIYGGDYCLIL